MIKQITITPAWDKTDPVPSKNYGIHGCNLLFRYGDPERGVVQFLLYTNWHLPEVTTRLASRSYPAIAGDPHWMERPQPADLGYHSITSQYEGQTKTETCDCLTQGFCYYDGSGLNAQATFETLLREGSDGVWKELETYYNDLFNDSPTS